MSAGIRVHCRLGDFVLAAECAPLQPGVTALYGPSGSGKTSLLRCLAGLEPAASLGGRGLPGSAGSGRVGYVFQDERLFPHLDVRGNLAFARKRAVAGRGIAVDQALEWLGLTGLEDRYPANLSGGERRRLAIARTLVNGPDVLLLDEPLNGLDRLARQQILELLQQLVRQLDLPVLYVSHQIEEIIQLADRMLVMQAGAIAAEGSLTEVLGRLDLDIARETSAGSILEGVILRHDEEYGLTDLDVGSGVTLSVQQFAGEVGSRHRLLVHARDISLAREKASDSSILNILPVSLDEMTEVDPFSVLLRLKVGEQSLLARITRKSRDKLGLLPGDRLYAQIKSVSLVTDYQFRQ